MSPEEKIEELILSGAVEVAGIDPDTGEFLYAFTDKILELDPYIAQRSEEIFNSQVYLLWEMGFLNIDMTSHNPIVSLMPKALDEDDVQNLPTEMRLVLKSIIEALRL